MSIELEILGMAWAIRPSKLTEITEFLRLRIEGNADFKDISAAIGKSGNKADQSYQVVDGTAIIPVFGIISKRANMMSDFSGGTSCQILQRDILRAVKDPAVKGIMLDVESPGGGVDGTKELCDAIYATRGEKPIIAFANGLMCSAAYWIGSACDAIVASDTAIVGSIGVVMTHSESSVRDAQNGIKKTDIFAGKYKRIAGSTKPLTEEGQAYLQSMVDAYYSLFVESVARNRGCDTEAALKMADGKEFIGKQALEVGLVDSIGTRENAMAQIKQRSMCSMDIKILQEQHPDLFAQVKKTGAEEAMKTMVEATKEAEALGTKQERDRVAEIIGADGDPAITAECIKTGVESGKAFKMLLEAEKGNKAKRLEDLKSKAAPNVGQELPSAGANKETFEGETAKLVASGKSKIEAMRAVQAEKPALYADFEARENAKRSV